MKTDTIHRLKTSAIDGAGKRIKFESFDGKRAAERLSEVRKADPTARLLRIPVAR